MNSKYKKKTFEDAALVSHLTYQIGESNLLRKKSQPVDVTKIDSPEIKKVISKLKKTLREYKRLTGKGKGIAAVQIGIPSNIAIFFIGKKIETIINPEIIEKSQRLIEYPEICMSANPIIAMLKRPAWIKVKYLNEAGEEKIWDNEKDFIINRVLQHEIDHTNGIINIDLVPSDKLILDSDPKLFIKYRKKLKDAKN